MTTAKQFREVPVSALRLTAEVETIDPARVFADGDTTRAPVRILARTADPITHPYWGRIVHDLAGMIPRKARTPIDYVHDGEPIGFADSHETTERGLEVAAELISTQPGDRAGTIIAKAAAGIPWEASIDWNGPGAVLEELADGESTEVNGREFSGPGFVARAWPLRSVAIVPFGADPGTAAQFSETTSPITPVEIYRKADEMPEHVDQIADSDDQKPNPETHASNPPTEPQPEPVAVCAAPAADPQPAPATVRDLKALCSGAPAGFDANSFIVEAAAAGHDLQRAAIEYTRDLEQFAANAADNAEKANAKIAAFDRGEEHPVSFDGPNNQPAGNTHPLQQFISIPSRRRRHQLN